MDALLPDSYTCCPVIPWPCRPQSALSYTGISQHHVKRIQDPLMRPIEVHGPAHRMLHYCSAAVQANKNNALHDTFVPLLGTTGTGKSFTGRQAVQSLLDAKKHAGYFSFPRFPKTSMKALKCWPNTGDQGQLDAMLTITGNDPIPKEEAMLQWTLTLQLLILATIQESKTIDCKFTDSSFDHQEYSAKVFKRMSGYTLDRTKAIVELTATMVSHFELQGQTALLFLDEIGTLLNSPDIGTFSSVSEAYSRVVDDGLPRPVSLLRALRHAIRNICASGVMLVVVGAGTDAGALNCSEFSLLKIKEYRPNLSEERSFQINPITSSSIVPPLGVHPVADLTMLTSDAEKRVKAILKELRTCAQTVYPHHKDHLDDLAEAYVCGRPIWLGYASLVGSNLQHMLNNVNAKVRSSVTALTTGLMALLFSGLGPFISSSYSARLLRHGFVTFHGPEPDISSNELTIDYTKRPPMVLSNPRDPLLASVFWSQFLDDSQRAESIKTAVRSLLAVPHTASAIGTLIGEPLAMLFFLRARISAAKPTSPFWSEVSLREIFSTLKVKVKPQLKSRMTTRSMDSTPSVPLTCSSFPDLLVNATHIVDAPTRKLTLDQFISSYRRGEAWRMPPATRGIDFGIPVCLFLPRSQTMVYMLLGLDAKVALRANPGSADLSVTRALLPEGMDIPVLFISFLADVSTKNLSDYSGSVSCVTASVNLSSSEDHVIRECGDLLKGAAARRRCVIEPSLNQRHWTNVTLFVKSKQGTAKSILNEHPFSPTPKPVSEPEPTPEPEPVSEPGEPHTM
eukprot:gnl/Dysnectes_brevis/2803_a3419_1345.p1 GENE.gnl/Dysnectes_brevis/2803_a3419_1345~~gnl/Dysnectes_brevis/2803_a3419_1345.p1  ORF type:complete len:801 (+),score=76.52 gnl/Dysnectes_brevis/2803_a3419_1345:22-2403(+)